MAVVDGTFARADVVELVCVLDCRVTDDRCAILDIALQPPSIKVTEFPNSGLVLDWWGAAGLAIAALVVGNAAINHTTIGLLVDRPGNKSGDTAARIAAASSAAAASALPAARAA